MITLVGFSTLVWATTTDQQLETTPTNATAPVDTGIPHFHGINGSVTKIPGKNVGCSDDSGRDTTVEECALTCQANRRCVFFSFGPITNKRLECAVHAATFSACHIPFDNNYTLYQLLRGSNQTASIVEKDASDLMDYHMDMLIGYLSRDECERQCQEMNAKEVCAHSVSLNGCWALTSSRSYKIEAALPDDVKYFELKDSTTGLETSGSPPTTAAPTATDANSTTDIESSGSPPTTAAPTATDANSTTGLHVTESSVSPPMTTTSTTTAAPTPTDATSANSSGSQVFMNVGIVIGITVGIIAIAGLVYYMKKGKSTGDDNLGIENSI